ncbi:MAG: hypothetical protein ACHQAX_08995 [Gammaproteobacteria bacterium]
MTTLHFFNVINTRMRKQHISDHEPVIEHDVMSWNIMMQGKYNQEKNRYNNGLELVETQAQYQQRLKKIAAAMADICKSNPHIQVICLQEAPILKEDVEFFTDCCLSYKSLQKFAETLRDENVLTSWGLMSLFNGERYSYMSKPFSSEGLDARVQKFKLVHQEDGTKRTVINLHLPFDKAKKDPGSLADEVTKMVKKKSIESKKEVMIAGDFNFPVTKFSALHQLGSVRAPKHNSTETHSANGGFNTLESVDAIIRVSPSS